jgi:hypothetical protein
VTYRQGGYNPVNFSSARFIIIIIIVVVVVAYTIDFLHASVLIFTASSI